MGRNTMRKMCDTESIIGAAIMMTRMNHMMTHMVLPHFNKSLDVKELEKPETGTCVLCLGWKKCEYFYELPLSEPSIQGRRVERGDNVHWVGEHKTHQRYLICKDCAVLQKL